MTEIVKICKEHGSLTIDEVRKDGNKFRCKACRIRTNNYSYYKNQEKRIATSIKWKQENREKANAWLREDRKKFPEKYREREKLKRQKDWQKISVGESLRKLGITNSQFKEMMISQDNKCAICKKEETCLGRSGVVKRLCIDHNHITNKVRELLCHDCNTGIGKFKDSIELLELAIKYLKKYKQ